MWKTNIMLNFQKMSKKQQDVATYMLENPESIQNMTIRQLATEVNVGQPTIIRTLEKSGYKKYKAFQKDVFLSQNQRVDIDVTKINNSHALQVIQDDIMMLAKMAQDMDFSKLSEVVKIIRKANIIDVYGTDNSSNAAAELSGKLLHLGLKSRNYPDIFYQKVSAEHLSKKDVAIAFSISGETKAVIASIENANKSGAVTIAVTSDEDSHLSQIASYTFITPTIAVSEVSKWITSRISQIAFVDALCAEVMASDLERFARELQKSNLTFKEDITDRAKWRKPAIP